jgi:hypothetical protein
MDFAELPMLLFFAPIVNREEESFDVFPTICMQFFMVDLVTVTKAQCASPMNYYTSLLLTVLTFKVTVLVVMFLAWALPIALSRLRALRGWLAVPAHLRSSTARRRSRRSASPKSGPPRRRKSMLGMLRSTDWVKVFRMVFIVLFIAYPSVSIKLLRMFNCKHVGEKWYLQEDMRLQCYVSEW